MSPSSSNLAGSALESGINSPDPCLQGVSLYGNGCLTQCFLTPDGAASKQKEPVLEVLNLLEAPERAATLACSNSITSLLSLEVNTKKPLRARRFSRRYTPTEAPTNATLACSCRTRSLKPDARSLLFQILDCRQHLRAVPAGVYAHV
jgi:hypothetical protein